MTNGGVLGHGVFDHGDGFGATGVEKSDSHSDAGLPGVEALGTEQRIGKHDPGRQQPADVGGNGLEAVLVRRLCCGP
jgi:hypothetical protein